MSRPLRIQYAGAHYHICARGNERRRLYWKDRDYEHFIDILKETSDRFEIKIYAFVLMTNHFHLMIQTPLGNLSQAMHWLKTSYTVWLNRKRGRFGHLFQGRYHSVIVEDESHYLELSRYIHLNPVRAGMVKRPEDHPWSSCHDYLNKKQKWPWLDREPVLTELGGKSAGRFKRYREFLYAGIGMNEESLSEFRRGFIIGGEAFRNWIVEKLDKGVKEVKGAGELVRSSKPSCKEAADILLRKLNAHVPHLANDRKTTMYLLFRSGYALREIGEMFGVSYSAVSQNARRYEAGKKDLEKLEGILSNVKR